MAWTDNLLPAALNGVPFLYKSTETELGRRGVVHEFPGRDDPFAEDLGRRARKYKISAFVLGENYATDRDNLIEVIEKKGDKTLTHPYLGDFTVKIIGPVRLTETDDEGRIARFDLELCESGMAFPLISLDTAARVTTINADLQTKLSTKTKFSLLGAIGAVLSSVARGLGAASSAIRKVNGKIAAKLDLIDDITAEINQFEEDLDSLINTPQALMNKFTALITSVVNLVKDHLPPLTFEIDVEEPDFPAIALAILAELGEFTTEADSIPTPTEQSELEHDAHEQVSITTQASTLGAVSDLLAGLELDSADSAKSIAQVLAAKFDEMLEADFDAEVHESLAALKAASIEHFIKTAAQLPQLTTYTTPGTMPALVIAYELYADASRDAEIIKRNSIRHPAFVPGGVDLEVVTE